MGIVQRISRITGKHYAGRIKVLLFMHFFAKKAAMNENALLPNGFADVLYPEAGLESSAVYRLLSCFEQSGYKQVKAPLMEFDTNFRHWASERVQLQAFRVMDPVSQSAMALRSDITTQVMRIVSTRLDREARPLRICYGGQVLRAAPEGARSERQMAQAGIELIGDAHEAAELEILMVTLLALHGLGVEGVTLDINFPALVRGLKLPPDILSAVEQKDEAVLRSFRGPQAETLRLLSALEGEADDASALPAGLPATMQEGLERCIRLAHAVRRAVPQVSVTLDMLDVSGFDYYTGITFSLYAQSTGARIAQGGRYGLVKSGEAAVGCGLDVHALVPLLARTQPKDTLLLPVTTPLKEVAALQDKGYILAYVDVAHCTAAQAKNKACTHILLDGKVKAL